MPTKPPEYDDPFGELQLPPQEAITAEPIPTGLSVEDDAKRLLAIQFDACFCPNCETYYDRDVGELLVLCPFCSWTLNTIDTKPLRRKR